MPGGRHTTWRSFNRRWRFLGGDTSLLPTMSSGSPVSIAGGDSWVGIRSQAQPLRQYVHVSIAGGDSWVGILIFAGGAVTGWTSFNRRWRFLGGDTSLRWVISPKMSFGFNRRWRFLGGDTQQQSAGDSIRVEFQSQVAILGWGYPNQRAESRFAILVSIAGGDSWVGIR